MKGLFILYHYPPALKEESPASSIQNLRLIQGLKSNGVEFTIIRKGKQDSSHSSNILSINSISSRPLKAITRRTIPDLEFIPDVERFSWAIKVKKHLSRLNLCKYDWVHTTCSPYSNHLIGLHLKKKYNLPWVAQFYDPWVDNPYRKLKYGFFRKLNQKQEAKVAENSDVIILSNDIIRRKWIGRYGNEIDNKILILPFCTDPEIKSNKLKSKNKKIVILHAGGIYGQRSIEELVNAIDKLNNEVNGLENKLEISLVGSVTKSEITRIKNKNLLKIFHLYGKKDYSFVQDQLEKADLLLVIDSLNEIDNVHFPSKLVEYFSYQKPIIGITSKNSACNNLLNKAGHFVFNAGQSEQLKQFLNQAINDQIQTGSFDKNFYKNFLPDIVAKNYIEMINKLV